MDQPEVLVVHGLRQLSSNDVRLVAHHLLLPLNLVDKGLDLLHVFLVVVLSHDVLQIRDY